MEELTPTLFHLECPSCGAPLKIHEGHVFDDKVKCEYCGSEYLLHGASIDKAPVESGEERKEYISIDSDYNDASSETDWSGDGVGKLIQIVVGFILFTILAPIAFSVIQNSSCNSASGVTQTNNSTITTFTIMNTQFSLIPCSTTSWFSGVSTLFSITPLWLTMFIMLGVIIVIFRKIF